MGLCAGVTRFSRRLLQCPCRHSFVSDADRFDEAVGVELNAVGAGDAGVGVSLAEGIEKSKQPVEAMPFNPTADER